MLEDLVASLENFILHVEDNFFVGFQAQVAEVVNAKQQELLPTPILILVLDEVLLHGVLHFGENCHYFVECLARDVPDVAVVLSLNGSSSSTLIGNESNFSEIASRAKDLYERVLSVFVCHSDLAFSLRNEIKLVC